MDPQYSPQGRTERLITVGRVVLAAASLLAVWLDPTQPAKYAGTTYALMIAYVVYSLLLALLVWSSAVPLNGLRLTTHGIDLGVFCVFIFLTNGPPSSPFFLYIVFAVVCAALRWAWPGTIGTAAVLLGIFISMGLYGATLDDDEVLNRFIIGAVDVAVIAVLLGYMAAHEQQRRSEVGKLAAWPASALSELRDVVRQALVHAAGIIGAPRVAMAWEEGEEPWLHVAIWTGEDLQWSREAVRMAATHVARPLEDTAFLCRDSRATPATVLHTTARGLARWHGSADRARVGGPPRGIVCAVAQAPGRRLECRRHEFCVASACAWSPARSSPSGPGAGKSTLLKAIAGLLPVRAVFSISPD